MYKSIIILLLAMAIAQENESSNPEKAIQDLIEILCKGDTAIDEGKLNNLFVCGNDTNIVTNNLKVKEIIAFQIKELFKKYKNTDAKIYTIEKLSNTVHNNVYKDFPDDIYQNVYLVINKDDIHYILVNGNRIASVILMRKGEKRVFLTFC